ncbi:hypothetical protein [Streptomyces solincola]|uniref:hypothetical protein n=1 Tax=Streptomyces solincola TaxID=2100817 RepID=UPI0011B2975F|nr:hypothetical protein [Streptomyces solincola]
MNTITVTSATAVTAKLCAAIRNGVDGETVDATGGTLPTHGYWVGGRSWTLVKSASRVTPDDVAGFVSAHPTARYFGVWVENGRAYLDIADHVLSPRDAHAMAVERNEIAVFNIDTGECEHI